MNSVKIALLQDGARAQPLEAADAAEAGIRAAARQGARIVCTQELFLTPYFCRTRDVAHFELAETVPGPTTERFAALARALEVVIVLSLFEKRSAGVFHNTSAVIDADGSYLGAYRKSHIPQDPFFEEKFYFTPGDSGFRSWKTRYAEIGVIVCWDQWFPESARATALRGAEIIFCPTAIGWLKPEKESVGGQQRHSWFTVQCGQAVANTCYYAAANRTGREEEIEFWGSSFVSDFYGRRLAEAPVDEPSVLIADCDLAALEAHRRAWPFFRDRRVDLYGDLLQHAVDHD